MSTKTVHYVVNIIAAIALTVAGSTTIPGCPIPQVAIFWCLLIAGVCKAVEPLLVQASGASDEEQGITPCQKAGMNTPQHPPITPASPGPGLTGRTLPLIAVLLFLTLPARAQTATNLPMLLGAGTNTQTVLADIQAFFKDAAPYLTNDIVQVPAGAVYDAALPKGKWGSTVNLAIPTGPQSAIGFGGLYLGRQWSEVSVNYQIGTTVKWPVIGNVYHGVLSGPSYNTATGAVGAFNLTTVEKDWDIGKVMGQPWYVGVWGGVGNDSTFPGTLKVIGAKLTAHW